MSYEYTVTTTVKATLQERWRVSSDRELSDAELLEVVNEDESENGSSDFVDQTLEEDPGRVFVSATLTKRPVESGRPCGCDPGANWKCEQHRETV